MTSIKLIITALSALIISIGAANAQIYEAKVISKYAEVRAKADRNSKVLRTLSKGVKVDIMKIEDDWALIKVNDKVGYVLVKDLKIENEEKATLKANSEEKPIFKETIQEEKKETKKEEIRETKSSSAIFGLKIGASFSKFMGDWAKDYGYDKTRTGFIGGAYYVNSITDNSAFQIDIEYAQKGGKYDSGGVQNTFVVDYLRVPISYRYDFAKPGVYLKIGAGAEFLINDALRTDDKTYTFKDLKKLDFGAIIGLGYSFDLSNNKCGLELNYDLGLTKIHDNSKPVDLKNSSIGIVFTIDL